MDLHFKIDTSLQIALFLWERKHFIKLSSTNKSLVSFSNEPPFFIRRGGMCLGGLNRMKMFCVFQGLAIDHYGRWLYWADAKRGEISAIKSVAEGWDGNRV